MEVRQASRFADRVQRLLERVEYRRADSPADKAAIYRLRHDAYMRAGTVEPKASGMFHDPMDEKNNAWLIGLFIDGELAGALRLHISASLSVPLPELASFQDLIGPQLAAGLTLIDGSRFDFVEEPPVVAAALWICSAVSAADSCLFALCGEDRRREGDKLRQFSQILGGGG